MIFPEREIIFSFFHLFLFFICSFFSSVPFFHLFLFLMYFRTVFIFLDEFDNIKHPSLS